MSTGPTQTRHPWRATVRTIFAAVIALLSLLPTIAVTGGLDTLPGVGQVLVVTGGITRVLAIPGVDAWIRTYVPWLAAIPADDPEPEQPPQRWPGPTLFRDDRDLR